MLLYQPLNQGQSEEVQFFFSKNPKNVAAKDLITKFPTMLKINIIED